MSGLPMQTSTWHFMDSQELADSGFETVEWYQWSKKKKVCRLDICKLLPLWTLACRKIGQMLWWGLRTHTGLALEFAKSPETSQHKCQRSQTYGKRKHWKIYSNVHPLNWEITKLNTIKWLNKNKGELKLNRNNKESN